MTRYSQLTRALYCNQRLMQVWTCLHNNYITYAFLKKKKKKRFCGHVWEGCWGHRVWSLMRDWRMRFCDDLRYGKIFRIACLRKNCRFAVLRILVVGSKSGENWEFEHWTYTGLAAHRQLACFQICKVYASATVYLMILFFY